MLKKYLVVVMTMGWSVFSAGICGAAEEGPKAAQPAEMSADLPAEVILDKVKVQYQSLKTYQAKGRVSFRMTFQGKSNDQETDYTMALGRPDFFKVVWTQEAAGQKHQGSAWNAGEGTFIYMGTGDIYAELKSGEMALGAAAGISGGSTNMIPPLFFNKRSLLGNLSNSHIERKEAVNGEECYVVTADSKSLQQKITLWISTKRLLILRSEYPLGKMSGAAENLTDQDIEEALKSMGEDVTEANKSRMKALMATQMKMAEGMNMEGKITEEISDIETDIPFSAKGFAFALPDTAQRRDSMFNFSLSEMEEMSTSMEAFGGTNVDDPQAQELEKRVAAVPEDLKSRFKLLGYYFLRKDDDSRRRKQEHILWIIENHPGFEGGMMMSPYIMLHPAIDGETYETARKLWLKNLQKFPDNPRVIMNAAKFFQLYEIDKCAELLKKGKELEPDNHAWDREWEMLQSFRQMRSAPASGSH